MNIAAETTTTAEEIMTISASRLLRNDKVVFAGIGLPLVASALARRRQAPNLTVVLEGGIVGTHLKPGLLPSSTNEMRGALGAEMLTSVTDIFLFAQRGFFDYGFIGVAQIDAYGNINTSIIGNREEPSVRLPGPGGANDIASLCNKTFVVTVHEPRRFVEKVDFITSPGYLSGEGSRADSGLIYGGPAFVVTDLALMDFAPDSRRMRLRALQPGVTVEQVVQATGFELLIHENVDELLPPEPEELQLLRELNGTLA